MCLTMESASLATEQDNRRIFPLSRHRTRRKLEQSGGFKETRSDLIDWSNKTWDHFQANAIAAVGAKVIPTHADSGEKELLRKEKALAEAAALLVLQKKVQAIWGDPEDD